MSQDLNTALHNSRVRPIWRKDVQTEQFANISTTLGAALTIPSRCTGITFANRTPTTTEAFFVYPQGGITGTETTGGIGTLLTDSTKNFTTLGVSVGDRVRNLTDGSVGIITIVGTTTVTIAADLSGGAENDWDVGDVYRIEAIADPRVMVDGGSSGLNRWFMALSDDRNVDPITGDAIYLLAEAATVDVDVFYHFD